MTLSKAPATACSVLPSPLTCLDPYSGLLTAFLVAILTSFTSLPTLQPQSSFQHGNQLWLLLCLKASNGFPVGLGVKFHLLAPGDKGLPDFLAHLPSPASNLSSLTTCALTVPSTWNALPSDLRTRCLTFFTSSGRSSLPRVPPTPQGSLPHIT